METWLWLPLAIGSALSAALADLAVKSFFGDLSPYTMSLARWLFAWPFLAAVGLFLTPPPLDRTFWLAGAAALPLELLAAYLYMQVLKVCHLSLCLPLLAFTPVFLILTGWLVLGEALNAAGLTGIALVTGGSFLLGIRGDRASWWEPLAVLARGPGARLMLLVAAIYAFTSALGKLAILHSEPAFFGVVYPTVVGGCLLLAYPLSPVRQGRLLARRWSAGLLVGLAVAGEIFCHVFGMKLAPAAYLIGVKRLSILFSVIFGGVLLQERPLLPRLAAAVLMVSGVILIAWQGS
ncbi:MAG: EamA family transporter [Desulfobaccales bacterium]